MSDVTHVVNPTTEQVIAEVPVNGVEATDEAVARARAALPGWQAVAPADRARLMRRFAAVVEDHHEELAQLETANVGKPIGESRDEVGMVAEVLYFYAGAVDKHRGATVPVAGGVDMTFHEPLGVVGRHHPLELPRGHHLVEGGPGAGHRQHHRGEAGRDHAPDRPPAGRAGPRGRPARGRAAGGHGQGLGGGHPPGRASRTSPRWPSPGRPRSVAT